MNSPSSTAGKTPSLPGWARASIALVGKLWDIECRYRLGQLSRSEYHQALARLRGDAAGWPQPP